MDKHDGTIVREGVPFIVGLGLLAAALFGIGLKGLAAVACAAMLFVAFFFRNPERTTPAEKGLVVSPADGKILKVEEIDLAASPMPGVSRRSSTAPGNSSRQTWTRPPPTTRRTPS